MSSPSNSGDKSLIFEDSMKSMNKCLIWFYGRSESSHISQKQYLFKAGFQKLPSPDDDALKRSQVRLGKANSHMISRLYFAIEKTEEDDEVNEKI